MNSTGTVDGLAYDEEGDALVMLLADSLGWEDEDAHILPLQDRLNAYAAFYEECQYEGIFPDRNPGHAVICIDFAGPVTEKASRFLEAAQAQLGGSLGIEVVVSIAE